MVTRCSLRTRSVVFEKEILSSLGSRIPRRGWSLFFDRRVDEGRMNRTINGLIRLLPITFCVHAYARQREILMICVFRLKNYSSVSIDWHVRWFLEASTWNCCKSLCTCINYSNNSENFSSPKPIQLEKCKRNVRERYRSLIFPTNHLKRILSVLIFGKHRTNLPSFTHPSSVMKFYLVTLVQWIQGRLQMGWCSYRMLTWSSLRESIERTSGISPKLSISLYPMLNSSFSRHCRARRCRRFFIPLVFIWLQLRRKG